MSNFFDFQSFPLLETERLILRQLSDADAPALFEFFRDPAYTQFLSFDTHTNIEQTTAFITWTADIFQQKDSIRWAIQLKNPEKVIGTAGLHFWDRRTRRAEVGYHIGTPFWGGGYATESLTALVDFGFQRMNLNRIEGRHNAGNDASGSVMRKLGFQREGILRQREIKGGEFVDVVQFSLLRQDYEH